MKKNMNRFVKEIIKQNCYHRSEVWMVEDVPVVVHCEGVAVDTKLGKID